MVKRAAGSLWIGWTFLPFGWLAWVAFLYVGARTRRRAWLASGAGYLAATVAALVLLELDDTGAVEAGDAAGTILSFVIWGVAIVHAFVIRKEYLRRREVTERADDAVLDRRIARELAASDPERARSLGIGRPDLPGVTHGGLIDVNSAPAEMLAGLPGVDAELAREIAKVREWHGDFVSAEDLGLALDLPARTVDRLRELAVFLRH